MIVLDPNSPSGVLKSDTSSPIDTASNAFKGTAAASAAAVAGANMHNKDGMEGAASGFMAGVSTVAALTAMLGPVGLVTGSIIVAGTTIYGGLKTKDD